MPDNDATAVMDAQSEAATADTKIEPQTQPDKTPESDADVKPRLKDQPIEQQLEVTRELMRKHEKQSRENYRMYEQAQSQLAEANTKIAFFELRRNHPQFTDEDISGCTETDPQAIAKWGDMLQAVLDRHKPTAPVTEPASADKPFTSTTPDLNRAVAGMNSPVMPKANGESPEELRKRFRDKYKRAK